MGGGGGLREGAGMGSEIGKPGSKVREGIGSLETGVVGMVGAVCVYHVTDCCAVYQGLFRVGFDGLVLSLGE